MNGPEVAEIRTYRVFISHTWRYNDEYFQLVRLLKADSGFKWINLSRPVHDPGINPDELSNQDFLTEQLAEQIRPAQCMVLLSGMMAESRFWIMKELELAKYYGIPVVGVVPWGPYTRILTYIDPEVEMLKWNSGKIIRSIVKKSKIEIYS